MVSVSPAQINLAPGEQTMVTVTVMPGSLVPQGSIPRVAVEGYAGSQLLGGVAVDIVVPNFSIALQQLRCPRDFCRTFSSANYANLR
jgi:hypothetical protein